MPELVTNAKPHFRIESVGTGPGTVVLYDGKPLYGVLGVTFRVRHDGIAQVLIEVDYAALDLDLPAGLLDVITICTDPDQHEKPGAP